MLRLTALLCAVMFLALLIGGEDRGQMRPGLLAAQMAAAEGQASQAAAGAVAEVAKTPAAEAAVDDSVLAVAYIPPEPVTTTPRIVTIAKPAVAAEPVVPTSADGAIYTVNARAVNVREGPSTSYAVIGKLSRGEAAMVVWAEENGWARILIEGDGIEGYVSMDLLTPEPTTN